MAWVRIAGEGETARTVGADGLSDPKQGVDACGRTRASGVSSLCEVLMPTVLREGGLRFFFWSGDRSEPPHIHVTREDRVAKFWLEPVRFASNAGFSRSELASIERQVRLHESTLTEAWDEFFGA
jgi:hypothetical protein